MAKLVCVLILVIIVVISADDSLARKDRSKRAVPAAAFFQGVFTWIMRALKFGMSISFSETRDDRMALTRDVVESVIAKLEKIQSAVNILEQNILDEIRQLKSMMKLHFAFSHHTNSVERLDELVQDFMYLGSHYDDDLLNQWVAAMLATDARGAKSVLFNIHKLVIGEKKVGREPIFQLFFENAVDNQNQSRLWQTEVYADSLLSHQVIFYKLWIIALHISNRTTLSTEVARVEHWMDTKLAEQFLLLHNIRRNPSAYHLPSSVEVKTNISQLCSATPTCIAKGYKLEIEGQAARLRPDCVSKQLQESFNPVCSFANKANSIFDRHRRFSTAMLTVPDRETQAICGVAITEEKIDRTVFIRLSADICLKNPARNLKLAHLPKLRSNETTQVRQVRWPYRLATSNSPKAFGWVTGVGLEVASDHSIQIKEQTDYFPSTLPLTFERDIILAPFP